jgi:hypothetical protein
MRGYFPAPHFARRARPIPGTFGAFPPYAPILLGTALAANEAREAVSQMRVDRASVSVPEALLDSRRLDDYKSTDYK